MAMTFATKVVETKGESKFITGTGTVGQAGSASAAYIPSLWTFNMGMTPVAGDMVTIKIPVAGVSSGVWMSVDNGTNYYPIAVTGKSRLTTQYANGYVITLVYETGFTTTLYGNTKEGGAAGATTADYTLNRWRIHNYYDSGNTNNAVTQTNTTGNANYSVLLSSTANTTSTKTEGARKNTNFYYNTSTKLLTVGGSITSNGKPVLIGQYSASSAPSSPVTGQLWLKQATMTVEEAKVLVVTTGSVSSLPTTVSDSNITADMEVIKSELSNPSAQSTDLTVSTSAGSLTVSGTISATTSIVLWLARCR